MTIRVQTAARAPFASLFSGVSTGGRERWSEGFLEAKSTETHEDFRSIGGNNDLCRKLVLCALLSFCNTCFVCVQILFCKTY